MKCACNSNDNCHNLPNCYPPDLGLIPLLQPAEAT